MTCYAVTPLDGVDWLGRRYEPGAVLADQEYIPNRPVAFKELEAAPFLQPFYQYMPEFVVWECVASGRIHDEGLRVAPSTLSVRKRVPAVAPSPVQHQRFGLICAASVYGWADFLDWANKWLNDEDRSAQSAAAMYHKLGSGVEFFRATAYAAVCGVTGLPDYPQYQEPLPVYSAAAGFRLNAETNGHRPLVPACRFAIKEGPTAFTPGGD